MSTGKENHAGAKEGIRDSGSARMQEARHGGVGVFGGTFDPIHNGHLELARRSKEQGKLDKVVLLVESEPWRKTNSSDLTHRLKMAELVANENGWLEVFSTNGAKLTVAAMLPQLQKKYGKDLVFVMGSDVFEHIASWKDVNELVKSSRFIIGLRDHNKTIVENVAFETGAEFMIITDLPDVSSSKIRANFDEYQTSLLPTVADYAKRKKLY